MKAKKVRERHLRHARQQEAAEHAESAGLTPVQLGVTLAIGLLFCLAAAVELGGVTPEGTLQLTHWTPWRDLSVFKTAALLLPPFLLVAWVLWRAESDPPRVHTYFLVALLVVASLSLQALSLLADPRGLQLVQQIAASPGATSYFTDALQIRGLGNWLGHFHETPLGFHSQTHPPGPIVFYYAFLRMFGPDGGARVGGWAIGVLASCGVAILYVLTGLWTKETRTRIASSAFYAVIPALALFFPEFDQVYPLVTMLVVLFWVKALSAEKFAVAAVWVGVVVFAATFLAYNLLSLGAFFAIYGMYRVWRGMPWMRLAQASGIVLGVCGGIYIMLGLATGFQPVASFERASAIQAVFALRLHRAYVPFVVLDLYDFFLGAGIVAAPILFVHLRRLLRHFDRERTDEALTLVGLGTVLAVDLSGLLRGETARVWLFLQPLLAVPVGMEIARVPWRWKVSIFAVQWCVFACLKAKMTFLEP